MTWLSFKFSEEIERHKQVLFFCFECELTVQLTLLVIIDLISALWPFSLLSLCRHLIVIYLFCCCLGEKLRQYETEDYSNAEYDLYAMSVS